VAGFDEKGSTKGALQTGRDEAADTLPGRGSGASGTSGVPWGGQLATLEQRQMMAVDRADPGRQIARRWREVSPRLGPETQPARLLTIHGVRHADNPMVRDQALALALQRHARGLGLTALLDPPGDGTVVTTRNMGMGRLQRADARWSQRRSLRPKDFNGTALPESLDCGSQPMHLSSTRFSPARHTTGTCTVSKSRCCSGETRLAVVPLTTLLDGLTGLIVASWRIRRCSTPDGSAH
jgi:hypothetical protein